MANKVYNMAGGLHSAAAYSGWENELFGGNAVASSTALKVGASSGMTVSVGKGNGLIDTGDDYARRVALTEAVDVTLDQADTSLPRNDLIVIYVDMAVAPVQTVQDNTNGILKVVAVKGTPAASPSDPDTGTIQQAIGAGNPYMILASIRVNAGASAISAGNITDKRPMSPNVYWTTSDITDIADEASESAVAPFANWNKVATITRDFGYAKQAALIRVGNIVICKTTGGNGKPAAGTWFDTGIKCPGGYKPRAGTVGTITGILPGGGGACVWVQNVPAGESNMTMLVSGDLSASDDYQGVGVWVTSDAWPS